MSSSSPARVFLTVLMDALVVAAVFLAAAIIVAFFGALAGTGVGQGLLRIASYLTLPLGVASVPTPYAGLFLVDATITVALALLAEWVLAGVRERI